MSNKRTIFSANNTHTPNQMCSFDGSAFNIFTPNCICKSQAKTYHLMHCTSMLWTSCYLHTQYICLHHSEHYCYLSKHNFTDSLSLYHLANDGINIPIWQKIYTLSTHRMQNLGNRKNTRTLGVKNGNFFPSKDIRLLRLILLLLLIFLLLLIILLLFLPQYTASLSLKLYTYLCYIHIHMSCLHVQCFEEAHMHAHIHHAEEQKWRRRKNTERTNAVCRFNASKYRPVPLSFT